MSMNSVVVHADREDALKDLDLTMDMFTPQCILGKGSYGTTLQAEFKDLEGKSEKFALKFLFKTQVAKTKRFHHVVHEKEILSQMSSPFVMKYYGE